ncbi:sulfotransferase [Sungkyunkwania multivorans]|uniref:Sulfotransferase n=1 Tax=Sungkyunkwania multivorans TaxID=1173618 RepID=A0ABW3D1X9_9FLAO
MFNRRQKVFCIGTGKTGTTTLGVTLTKLGYTLGNQEQAELLIDAWHDREFIPIISYCKSANAFQDIPFSLPHTYEALDNHFPKAKFILTERDSAEQWYRSLTRFHAKLWSNTNEVPTKEELQAASYRHPGYAYKAHKYIYNTSDDDLYNEEKLKSFYLQHNSKIKEYFTGREDKLLIINVSKKGDFAKLCDFLGVKTSLTEFPWENKT